MGSLKYFFREVGNKREIELKPEELKYIITCKHPEEMPYSYYFKRIKPKIEKAIENNEALSLNLNDLQAFPTLYERILLEKDLNILNYFEGMGEKSHNKTLIYTLERIIEANPKVKADGKLFNKLVRHVQDCTVQIAQYKGGEFKLFSPNGLRNVEMDLTYLGKVENGNYFTTHGVNESGRRFGIRVVKDKKIINRLKEIDKLWNRLCEKCGI